MSHSAEKDAPPEVLIGALANMIEAASQARDECHDDLMRSWHQGRVSALMDAKRQTESWVASVRTDEWCGCYRTNPFGPYRRAECPVHGTTEDR